MFLSCGGPATVPSTREALPFFAPRQRALGPHVPEDDQTRVTQVGVGRRKKDLLDF